MYGFPKYGHILSCHAQSDVRIISFAIMVSHCVLAAWLFNLCIVTYTASFVGKCYVISTRKKSRLCRALCGGWVDS